ncbi:hypothetical protein AcV7_005854 [Taiwanofungus camphoratus]|nr:hypothetical protein AcV7_005854 [Antrodia cinnamomea]
MPQEMRPVPPDSAYNDEGALSALRDVMGSHGETTRTACSPKCMIWMCFPRHAHRTMRVPAQPYTIHHTPHATRHTRPSRRERQESRIGIGRRGGEVASGVEGRGPPAPPPPRRWTAGDFGSRCGRRPALLRCFCGTLDAAPCATRQRAGPRLASSPPAHIVTRLSQLWLPDRLSVMLIS